MPLLKRNRLLTSDETGRRYRVDSTVIARGGYGEVYRGVELNARGRVIRDVAIKVSLSPISWHGEAYFGRLLADQPNVVPFHDAFPVPDSSVKYVVVLEWMHQGTVEDNLDEPWPERRVRAQMARLLQTLVPMHQRSICHGDITPRNIFVEDKRLLLGDLGIAHQSLKPGRRHTRGAPPSAFQPPDTPAYLWSPAEDIYQLGLLAVTLLTGSVTAAEAVGARALRALPISDELKGWLHDCLAPANDRFADADEALSALRGGEVKPAPRPRSLEGEYLVFSGRLPTMTREEARHRAEQAGAIVQQRVNGMTTVVVAGEPNPLQVGQTRGTKLFDAHRRLRRGQRIAILDPRQFQRLLPKP